MFFIVDQVHIEGNDKTSERVIFNELDFAIGDTVFTEDLQQFILENEKRLLSTALFTIVDIELQNYRPSVQLSDVKIMLQENWYIYPAPIFELADRNFNDWWTNQNRDFGRVNYGLNLQHINFTGNKDKLKLKGQFGYERKFEVNYQYPYISRTWGVGGEVFYADRKEIAYRTENNKLKFFRQSDERVMLNRFRAALNFKHRPNAFIFHDFTTKYYSNAIDGSVVADLNSDFFLQDRLDQKYFAFLYSFRLDKRVFNFYPEGGYQLSAAISQNGFGIFGDLNILSVSAGYEQHFKFSKKWLVGGRIKGKSNITRSQVPYFNNQALGYENDLVRGYELYVIDGTDYLLAKTSIRYLLFESMWNWKKAMPIQQLRQMNTRIFLRANFDLAYVNEPTYKLNNPLANELLYGFGPAVDILLYHTYILSLEYSFNREGESGLYIKADFNF